MTMKDAFSLRYQGIKTIAKQEFRVRLRTGRWRWLLFAWLVVIGGFTVLLRLGLAMVTTDGPAGIPLFGGLMIFVLGLSLLVAPALTAQSINGDRERGTLATVQVTRLSAADIALGKLVASWGTGLVFLALTVPFVVWSILEGGVSVGRAAVVLLVVAALIGVICAVAQGFSALLDRGITSTLLSYLLVFALTGGTLIAFGLATVAFTERPEPASTVPGQASGLTMEPHTEDVWWLLAPNPFVVLADAAPEPPLKWDPEAQQMQPSTTLDPLSALGYGARLIRTPTSQRHDGSIPDGSPVWPYGLGFDVLLGVGAVWTTTRRLRAPVRTLRKGVRIA